MPEHQLGPQEASFEIGGRRVTVRLRPPEAYQPNPNNTNQGKERGDSAIRKSLESFGFHRGIFTSADDVVIGGNHAYEAATEADVVEGWIEVETDGSVGVATKRIDWEDHRVPEAIKAAIADNRTQQLNFDLDLNQFRDDLLLLAQCGQEVDPVFYTKDETTELLMLLSQEETGLLSNEEEQENASDLMDEADSGSIKSRVKLGEIWALGRHRIACGDSTNEGNVKRLLGDKFGQVDLVFTDPPYNVAHEGRCKSADRTREKMKIENDDFEADEDFLRFLKGYFFLAINIARKGCPIYVFYADRTAEFFYAALRETGWLSKQAIIWVKNNFTLGRQDYRSKHEPILYGWKPGDAHKWYSDRSQSTVWEFDCPVKSKEHPTMKPIDLIQYALRNSSAPADLIYDGFLGSGSTLIAAQGLEGSRSCYGFELSPDYCEVIIRRFEEYTGATAELAGHL